MKSFTVFALMSGVVASGLLPSTDATFLFGGGGGLLNLGGARRSAPVLGLNLGGSSSCNSCGNSPRAVGADVQVGSPLNLLGGILGGVNVGVSGSQPKGCNKGAAQPAVNAQVNLPSVNVGARSIPQGSVGANVNVRAAAPAVNVGLPSVNVQAPQVGVSVGAPVSLPNVNAQVNLSGPKPCSKRNNHRSHSDSSSSEEDQSSSVNINSRSLGSNVGVGLNLGGLLPIGLPSVSVQAPQLGVSLGDQQDNSDSSSSEEDQLASVNVNPRSNVGVNVGLPIGLPSVSVQAPQVGVSVGAPNAAQPCRSGCNRGNGVGVGVNVGGLLPAVSVDANVAAPNVGVSVNGRSRNNRHHGHSHSSHEDLSAGVNVGVGNGAQVNVGLNSRSLGSDVGLNVGGLSLGLPNVGVSLGGQQSSDISESDESNENGSRRRKNKRKNRHSLLNLDVNILNSRRGGRSERRRGLFEVKVGDSKVAKKNNGCVSISVPLLAAPAINANIDAPVVNANLPVPVVDAIIRPPVLPPVNANVNANVNIDANANANANAANSNVASRSLSQSSNVASSSNVQSSSVSSSTSSQTLEQQFIELTGSASVEITDMASAVHYWRQGQMDPAIVSQIEASVAKAGDPQLADMLRQGLIEAINAEVQLAADSGAYN